MCGQPFSHTTGSGRSTEYALRTGQNEYSSIPSGGNGERRYYARWRKQLYDAVKNDKAVALRNGMDHGKMLYSADGYVTAWFMWYLKGDTDAAKVFTGDAPELLRNQLYQEQQIDISCIN